MSYKLYAKDYADAPEVPILRLNDDMVAHLKMQISSLQKQGKTLAQIADLIEISIDGTTLTMEGEEHTLDARTEAAPVEVFQVTEKGFELVGLNKKKYSVKRKMTEQVRMEVKDKSRQEEDKRNSRQYVLPLLGKTNPRELKSWMQHRKTREKEQSPPPTNLPCIPQGTLLLRHRVPISVSLH
jgi:hypothetical protein